ncbi:homeobox protein LUMINIDEPENDENS-like [Chenopodium quinoa]|uniref:homeobox protein LUMINIDEPENDENS-like n=1 Tax=Chenopodium quinoa TaxID=63459 RepID=UPI000B77C114|nr:homeobox protein LUMINIDEPENDENS-like [Chenopodium quinoa]
MEVLKDYPSEIDIGSSMESVQKGMELQKQLFHTQIDQLRNVVVTQCKLTGVNPLSQEMAAGALSINIGKRPRDLLNPKALQYMQAVFSMKDAISKKESREIGALFGLTVTQAREYFASQRSRVRKLVRLSRERAIRANGNKELQDIISADSDLMLPIDTTPLSSIGPDVEEAPSCSNQDEGLPGLGESEKDFVENIFSSMCKEETFSGQVKLMDWILQIENPTILCWFLTKGGVMILATWLSQAATEEQTSVISAVLKVLCHLPLNKALPAHMSAILQGVNKLRFYRVPDISNRARVLLSKWSKMFVKSQALKKSNGIRAATEQDTDLTQRFGELVGDYSWQSSVDASDDMLVTSYLGPDDTRKVESIEAMKLLTASSDESNKKLMLGTSTAHIKERRKVQLVEQPGQKSASNSQPIKAVAANQRRPITADEIQKAKMRAQIMQSSKRKTEGPKKPSLLTNDLLSASEAYLRPKLEAQKKARLLPPKSSIKQAEFVPEQKPAIDQKESLLEKCRRVQIPWLAPPEVHLVAEIGNGENSKEMEVQRNRIHREKETTYRTLQDVPPNPKEPWDVEMDYDDTLTPEIPIDQLPDAEGADTAVTSVESQNPTVAPVDPATSSQAEPDLELLAVLLKNPELVFALTSGQASGLSSEDTVKLLDLLKSNGGAALLNGQASEKPEEVKVEVSLPSPTPTPTRNVEVSLPSPTPPSRFEVSLPSPTPSTNLGPSGWTTTEAAKNPFSRRAMEIQDTMAVFPVAAAVVTLDRPQNNCGLQPQFPSAASAVITSLPQHHPSQTLIPEYQPTYFPPAPNQNPPMPSYSRPSPALSQSQMHAHAHAHSHPHHLTEQYLISEGSNKGVVKARHGLSHTPFSNHVSQNVYNPTMAGSQPGPPRERNDYHMGGHKGYESWSPENSPGPVRYPPEHHHGHGWSYPEQRERGYGPPDRLSRNRNWRGGGSVNRRWNSGDRRR